MASICNDERGRFGVLSGHDRKTLSLSAAQHHHLGHEADEEHHRHRRQDQAQAAVGLALGHKFGIRRAAQGRQAVQASTLVALASSLGGVSKVWYGTGEGSSHSRPSAPSQGFWAALGPMPRIIGITTKMKK